MTKQDGRLVRIREENILKLDELANKYHVNRTQMLDMLLSSLTIESVNLNVQFTNDITVGE